MKIQRFNKFGKSFESYSFPDSVTELSNWISTFINKKIRWWVSRNSLANYKEEFVIDREEMGIDPNPDFPFERINLQLKLTNNSKDWNLRGAAAMFKRKNWIDIDLDYSRFNHGKIVPSIKFNVQSNKHVIDIQEIEETIISITRHELLHIYQYYKKYKNKSKQYTNNAAASAVLDTMDQFNNHKNFSDFMYLLYIFLTKEEFEANLAEFTPGVETYKMGKLKELKNRFETIPKKDYTQEIKKELSKSEMSDIVMIFSDVYKSASKSYNLTPSKFIINLSNKGFDHFINSTYDIVKDRMSKWSKKINKINYIVYHKNESSIKKLYK